MGWKTSGVIMSIEDCLWLWMCKIGVLQNVLFSICQHGTVSTPFCVTLVGS